MSSQRGTNSARKFNNKVPENSFVIDAPENNVCMAPSVRGNPLMSTCHISQELNYSQTSLRRISEKILV